MKTKKVTYPTGVWVSFGSQGNIIAAGMMPRRELYYSSKLYHLHPGNEVKRALNEIKNCFSVNRYSIAHDLRQAGFRVRWDAKRGKFV